MATMRLDCVIAQLGAIREFVVQTSRELGVDESTICDLQLAVDEICSNVLRHGYDGRGGQVEVTVESVEDGVQVTVRDWGRAFEPQAVPLPDVRAPLEQRPLGGLGLFLVRQVMDEVQFEFGGKRGNSVTMVKRFQRQGEEEWT